MLSTERKSRFENLVTGKDVYIKHDGILQSEVKLFDDSFVTAIDMAIINNNFSILSKQQNMFFRKYAAEADAELSDEMQQFDSFLGGII